MQLRYSSYVDWDPPRERVSPAFATAHRTGEFVYFAVLRAVFFLPKFTRVAGDCVVSWVNDDFLFISKRIECWGESGLCFGAHVIQRLCRARRSNNRRECFCARCFVMLDGIFCKELLCAFLQVKVRENGAVLEPVGPVGSWSRTRRWCCQLGTLQWSVEVLFLIDKM